MYVGLNDGLGDTGVVQTKSCLYRFHITPRSKAHVFCVAFMSEARLPDETLRPQCLDNHK